MKHETVDSEKVRQAVREGYGRIAQTGGSCCGSNVSCCGFDGFIAGRKVGASGRVIGVDMTTEMLQKARKNLATYRKLSGWDNVEFRLGEIEHLPLADASVD